LSRGRGSSESLLDNEKIVELLDISNGSFVVDAGFGTGYMSMLMSEKVGEEGQVVALDINSNKASTFEKSNTRGNIEVMCSDISKVIPLKDSSADLILLWGPR